MFYTIIASILVLTTAVYILKRMGIVRVCPICAGIAGTWMGLIIGRAAGWDVEPAALAILLGASVAGITYLVEKKKGQMSEWRKAALMLTGLAGGWGIVKESWIVAAILLALFTVLLALKGERAKDSGGPVLSSGSAGTQGDLVKKLEDCC